VLFFGAYLVQIGELNIGQFVASEIIIFLVINSVEKLVSSLSTCYDIITALYKIESIFGENQEFSFVNTEVLELEGVTLIFMLKNLILKPLNRSLLAAFLFTGIIICLCLGPKV
jgi:ABC-type bacteriocin/lantibiotic exporter with double-glycine peptidase domain